MRYNATIVVSIEADSVEEAGKLAHKALEKIVARPIHAGFVGGVEKIESWGGEE
jgi:hypothetical protein